MTRKQETFFIKILYDSYPCNRMTCSLASSFFILSAQSVIRSILVRFFFLSAPDAHVPRCRGNIYVPAIHVCDNSTNGGHYHDGRSTATQNYSRLHLRDFRCTRTRARGRRAAKVFPTTIIVRPELIVIQR